MHAQRRAFSGTRAHSSGGKVSFTHQHAPLLSGCAARAQSFGWPQRGHRSGLKDIVKRLRLFVASVAIGLVTGGAALCRLLQCGVEFRGVAG